MKVRDCNIEEVIDYMTFDDEKDLAQCMLMDIESEVSEIVCVICKYKVASDLISELLKNDNTSFIGGTLEYDEFEYDKEYIITLSSDLEVFCEKIHDEYDGYFVENLCGAELYVHSDCSSETIIDINVDTVEEIVEFEFERDIDDDEDCCECCNCNKRIVKEYNGYTIIINPIVTHGYRDCMVSMDLIDKHGTSHQTYVSANIEDVIDRRNEWIKEFM